MSFTKPSVIIDPRNETARIAAEGVKSYVIKEADHFLVFGGDGTMIRAIHSHHGEHKPFYGINHGHIGFLMNKQINLEAKKIGYDLSLLNVSYSCRDGRCGKVIAVNDAWVERSSSQTAKLSLHVDSICRIPNMYADGLLLCTAQGSTAYARSMGGIPIPLTSDTFQVVGSNVAFPSWKSALIDRSQRVEFRNEDNQDKRPIRLLADGFVIADDIHSVSITKSRESHVHLLFDEQYNLAEKIAKVQFP